jgi:hypothetical protein
MQAPWRAFMDDRPSPRNLEWFFRLMWRQSATGEPAYFAVFAFATIILLPMVLLLATVKGYAG